MDKGTERSGIDRPLEIAWHERQRLTNVFGVNEADHSGPGYSQITLEFERSSIQLSTDEADGLVTEARSTRSPDADGMPARDLSLQAPWSSAVGKPLLWFWSMTNQFGIRDGVQLQFAENVETKSVTIQILTLPCAVTVWTVQAVEPAGVQLTPDAEA
jgi:hypothetical protein